MSKRSVHLRYRWSDYDLKLDGMMKKERLKGKLKKIYQKTTRNRLKKENLKECKCELQERTSQAS